MNNERRKNENLKHILVSIFVGACVAFMTTLFQSLADFVTTHGADLFNGAVASAVYLAKSYRA